VIKSGIVLIFIPLLTLSADVMHKFEAYNPTWVNVGVYHLDEMYDCDHQLYSSFLLSCSSMRRDTSSTFFVFLSPLINHRNALAVFVACAHDRTLRAIASMAHPSARRFGHFELSFSKKYLETNRGIFTCG